MFLLSIIFLVEQCFLEKNFWVLFFLGYKPCEPQIVQDRMSHLDAAYEELKKLSADRRSKLDESRKLHQFYWDMADEEGWIKEKEQLMSSPDLGHDLTSVNLLVNKHKVCGGHWVCVQILIVLDINWVVKL